MKGQILNDVKEQLAEGNSHQEIFDQLKEKYAKNGKMLTDILCKLPIPSRKKNLKFLWAILVTVLSGLALLRVLSFLVPLTGFEKFVNLFFLVILLFIIYSVARYEKYTFQFLGVLGLLNIFLILKPVISQAQILTIDGYISLLLVIAMCICSYVLYYKLFVKHKVEKAPVKYMDGRQGFEIRAKFTER